MRLGIAIGIFLCALTTAFAQDVQVNRQNRTVDVRVTAKVSAVADLADVTIGCDAHGQTLDQTYQENLKKADKVLKALLEAGVPKNDISSGEIQFGEMERTDSESKPKPAQLPRFEASQTWTIRVAATDAQKVIDVAMAAGATGVENVRWALSNPDSVEAKARTAALEKARQTAAEIAATLGGKLGDALFVSNESMMSALNSRSELIANSNAEMKKVDAPPSLKLQLFPEKIEKGASVRVVFALN